MALENLETNGPQRKVDWPLAVTAGVIVAGLIAIQSSEFLLPLEIRRRLLLVAPGKYLWILGLWALALGLLKALWRVKSRRSAEDDAQEGSGGPETAESGSSRFAHDKGLNAAYHAMADDKLREEEADEWSESLIGDLPDETR